MRKICLLDFYGGINLLFSIFLLNFKALMYFELKFPLMNFEYPVPKTLSVSKPKAIRRLTLNTLKNAINGPLVTIILKFPNTLSIQQTFHLQPYKKPPTNPCYLLISIFCNFHERKE